jgi:glycine/D-amino acid oxidase-like deaminating enzyme
MLNIAAQRGASICAPVELVDVVPQRATVGLATAEGIEIETRSVIFATGYELAHGVPAKGHKRSSTWAFATRPQTQALKAASEAVIWEASDPYLYMRSTIDGRLVVGGEDEEIDDAAKRDALLAEKMAVLQDKTRRILPWLSVDVDYSWAGTFGESQTGLPTIGPVPGMPHCYAVLGYGGNGITFGYLAAQLLRGYVIGHPDPDSGLFAFK